MLMAPLGAIALSTRSENSVASGDKLKAGNHFDALAGRVSRSTNREVDRDLIERGCLWESGSGVRPGSI
jgi:hypothetical protein